VKLARQEKVIILGSQGLDSSTRFYFIPESQNGLGVPVVLLPHDFGENGKPARGTPDAHDWTVDRAVSFTSRPVFEDRSLSVLQIVAKSTWNRLYWIGVGKEHPSPDFDLIELAGGSQYANCGDYDVPPSVVDVKNIDHPFRAALQLQPPHCSLRCRCSTYSVEQWSLRGAAERLSANWRIALGGREISRRDAGGALQAAREAGIRPGR
jgi:hypothetical protein